VSFAHPKMKVWLRHWPETAQSALSKGPVYTIKFSFKDIVTPPLLKTTNKKILASV
jgi:hypothetical protein